MINKPCHVSRVAPGEPGSWQLFMLLLKKPWQGNILVPTWQGPERSHLLDQLRRTQRTSGMGADGRGEGESCILGGGVCRASREESWSRLE